MLVCGVCDQTVFGSTWDTWSRRDLFEMHIFACLVSPTRIVGTRVYHPAPSGQIWQLEWHAWVALGSSKMHRVLRVFKRDISTPALLPVYGIETEISRLDYFDYPAVVADARGVLNTYLQRTGG